MEEAFHFLNKKKNKWIYFINFIFIYLNYILKQTELFIA